MNKMLRNKSGSGDITSSIVVGIFALLATTSNWLFGVAHDVKNNVVSTFVNPTTVNNVSSQVAQDPGYCTP